jgi:hypothetical protein
VVVPGGDVVVVVVGRSSTTWSTWMSWCSAARVPPS